MPLPNNIPVFLLSGFLGSGKSTLLNSLLKDPEFADTAVVINEFGDTPIDHLLVREGETAISQVSTGCLCCSGTTDLRSTLFDLHCAASAGLCPSFSRVIVEMSGLGDPAPLVNALMPRVDRPETLRDKTVDDVFHLSGFVTLYDIITGPISIEQHFEALKQIAFADQIVLTKTDLANDPATKADLNTLPAELKALNAGAVIYDKCDAVLSILFKARSYMAAEQGEDVAGWLALDDVLAADSSNHDVSDNRNFNTNRHSAGIKTFSIIHEQSIPEKQFRFFLNVLMSTAGPKLLRVKGIVAIAEEPTRPRIIHIVQHLTNTPLELEAWPDDDHRTRLVFITNGIDPQPVEDVFHAIIKNSTMPLKGKFSQLTSRFKNVLTAGFYRLTNTLRRFT